MAGLPATCPGCGHRAQAPPGAAGKTLRCPRCGTRFLVGAEVAPTALEKEATAGPAHSQTSPTAQVGFAPAAEWQVGDVVLDLYEVKNLLGQGGMGRVYRVRHLGWNEDLAVKTPLPSALQRVGGASNFEREAETWVSLGLHPHVVSCYYVRRVGGIPCVFAELVEGGTLHDWIRQRRLRELDKIVDVAIQFAWGLHYAHQQGLVHQDVKPANVLVAADGLAKVTDFGLARARPAAAPVPAGAEGQTMSVPGGGGGTLAYMAPEQTLGGLLTRRADLWGWALSLLETFLGERIWDYGPAGPEALEQYLARGGKALGLPAMPASVVELLRRCLQEDPEKRPRTLWDAAAALYSVYEEATSCAYTRPEPQSGRETADSLNNRAVSLLDLGRDHDADALWSKALVAQPHHVEATYNQAAYAWTHGRLSDEEMLKQMEEACRTHASAPRADHLLAKLFVSVGEHGRAVQNLEAATRSGPGTADLERDLGLALCAVSSDSSDAGAWRRASECFASAMQARRETAADIVGYALCLARLGGGEKARAFYGQAAARRRDLPPALADAIAEHLPGRNVLRLLKGLSSPATALALTRDGQWALAAEGDVIRMWDARTGAAVRTLQERGARVRAMAVTPDGHFLLRADEGAVPQLWDLQSGRPARAFQPHPGFLTSLTVSGDGRHAVSGGSDRSVRVWEISSGRCLRVLEGHREAVTCIALDEGEGEGEGDSDGGVRGGVRAVSGSIDGTVRVWDLASGTGLATLEGHDGRVNAVAFAEPNGAVVSAGEDRRLRFWDPRSGTPLRTLAGHTQAVTGLLRSVRGHLVLSCGLDRTLRAWDPAAGRMHELVRLDGPIQAMALGPGGEAFAASGAVVAVVRIPERARLPSFAVSRPVSAVEAVARDQVFLGRVDAAQESLRRGELEQALGLARTARSIPGFERSEAALAVWDELCAVLPRKGLQGAWETAALEGHRDPVLSVAVSPDGGRALSGGMDATVRLWDVGRRELLAVLEGHQETVASVAFSTDGRGAFSGSWDRTARVWDLASGRVVRSLEGHEEYVSALAVSPDGAQLLTGSWDQTLRVWDLATGKSLGALKGHDSNIGACAFGADARYAVSGGWDRTVRAWDVASCECVCVLEGHEGNVVAVALSPSGRQAASGGADAAVRHWDLRGRRTLRVLSGHAAEVTSVAFTPDGRYLLSASRDKTVRVWDLATGRCERTLELTAGILGVAVTPSGNGVVLAGADRTLRVWHLDWEPEARPLPPWDEKARPFIETFLSLRLKPQTTAVGRTGQVFSDDDLDALVEDVRHRGFGGLQRETVAGKLRDLTTRAGPPPSFWEEVRRSAPKAPRKVARRAAQSLWQRIGARRAALAAMVALSIVVGVLAWFRPPARPRLVEQMLEGVRDERKLIDLGAFAGESCAEGGLDRYWELAREREVSAVTLSCLARLGGAGIAESYLDGMVTADDDPMRTQRQLRNAVSLMAGLGDGVVDALCGRLGDARDDVRLVASRALAAIGSDRSTGCLIAATNHVSPVVRATAASVLDRLLAASHLAAVPGWEIATRLLRDPDPAVRGRALGLLPLFGPELARRAASRARSDPDPDVRAAADRALAGIEATARAERMSGR